jgi:hypothetical protein
MAQRRAEKIRGADDSLLWPRVEDHEYYLRDITLPLKEETGCPRSRKII